MILTASQAAEQPVIWKITDVAKHLGIPVSRVRELAVKDGFPHSGKFGNRRRWLADSFKGFTLDQVKRIAPKCQLYHHYDKDDNLLYVGISLSAISRLRQHNKQSHWADQIVKILVTQYDSVADAKEAEKMAIRWEQPLYNKMHVPKK